MHRSCFSLIGVLAIGVCVAAALTVVLAPAAPIGWMRFEPILFEPFTYPFSVPDLALLVALLALLAVLGLAVAAANWLRTGPGTWSLHARCSSRARRRYGGWALV